MKKIATLLFLTLLIASCGQIFNKFKFRSSQNPQSVSGLFNADQLNLKVYYESGAEPYVGGPLPSFKYWDLAQKNLEALFVGKDKAPSISVPKELNEMSQLSSYNKATWSAQEVLDISKSLPADTTSFQIFFLNGVSDESANTIGFHISGTRIIAVFKDVIKNMTQTEADPLVPRYVEQSTIIHEMGHALGLVNNGLPMVTAHQDVAHGAHCNDPNCVMYYSNEGTTTMTAFAKQAAIKGSVVIFDQACLDDAKSYTPPK